MATLQEQIEKAVAAAVLRGRQETYRQLDPRDRAVSRHEAAHCVVDYLQGRALESVSVNDFTASGETVDKPRIAVPKPDEPVEALRARMRAEHPGELRAFAAKEIVSFLAGVVADEWPGGLAPASSQHDLTEVARLAAIAVSEPAARQRFIAECRDTTRTIVRDAWDVICELGTLIWEHRRLPGPIVEAWLDDRARVRTLRESYQERYAAPSTSGKPLPPAPDDTVDWWSDV